MCRLRSGDHRHRPEEEEDVQDVPISVSTLAGEDLEAITVGSPTFACSRPCTQRHPRVVLRSSLSALLYPRSRQHRLRPQCLTTGLDDRRRGCSGKSGRQGDAAFRPAADRGVARTPGHSFRPQHPGRYRQVRHSQTVARIRSGFRASYGTFNTIDINGGVGGPLSDPLSRRFSGLYQSRSDWITNGTTGEKELGGYTTKAYRLQALWEPNDKFSGLFNFHGWDVDGTARVFRANILEAGSGSIVSGFSQDMLPTTGRTNRRSTLTVA